MEFEVWSVLTAASVPFTTVCGLIHDAIGTTTIALLVCVFDAYIFKPVWIRLCFLY